MSELGTFVAPVEGGFKWWLIGEFNNHVLAQGFTRYEKVALRQASDAKSTMTYELSA